jgi:lipoprotein-anchoring transpeptidase ErfK/SrfK
LLAARVPSVAHADRFGPPWMDRVTVDQTTLYASPDRSEPVGPLGRDTIVVVLDQQGDMIRVPDGWVAASEVTETTQPWVAEVSEPSVSVYAYPDASSDVRRTAKEGDLLRVTGVAHGVGSDQSTWWATTEGYVDLSSVRPATSDWAKQWTLPSTDLVPLGWWAEARDANVRAGPTTDAPILGSFAGGEHVKVLGQEQGQDIDGNATWDRIDGGRYAGGWVHSGRLDRLPDPQPAIAPPPPDSDLGDKPWIVVDRPAHTLTLLRNGQPQFTTYISIGKAGEDTPAGNYSTWGKYPADRMLSAANPDADHGYNLPNVPFVQYYKDGGYAIHGTYWHDQFGTNESQGCINLTWTDAAYLFGQTLPEVAPNAPAPQVTPTTVQQATPVVIL